MKAYANPAVAASTPGTTTRPLGRIAAGAAARIGAIAGGLIWVLGAAIGTAFDLFGVDLWRTVIEGQWIWSAGWESLPVFMANFGGLVLGAIGVIIFGALVGTLTAWIYNLTVPTPPVEDDYF